MNYDNIIANLKLARQEAFDQIERINTAIEILLPKPKIQPPMQTANQYKAKFMEVIRDTPLTAAEIRRKAGFMSESQTYKYLKELNEEGRIDRLDINKIRHYRKPREELRLIAGSGVKSHKRLSKGA
jgi:hypothetical protein